MIEEILEIIKKGKSAEEPTEDPEILKVRSEQIKKVDCAITVTQHMKPMLTIIRASVILFFLSFFAYALLGITGGGMFSIIGIAVTIYTSKKYSDQIAGINAKYKIR